MVRDSKWDREDPTATDGEHFGDVIESTMPGDAGEYDAVLLGEPYDGGTTGRAGAREAPAAIRDALAGVQTHHLDAGPVDSVGDLGAVEIPAGASVSGARETVRETVDELHDADTVPVILGGSGSLTYANVAGLLEATAVTDGGYVTDGGFGEDEESVGDVEHFDPSGAGESTDEDEDSETDDDEKEGEAEETDDSDAGGSAEAEDEADEESTEDDESESETDDERDEGDETEGDAADEENEEQVDEGEGEAADDEDEEADETEEGDDGEPAEEDADETPDESAESTDDATTSDTDEGAAVDDTAFATPDGETETEVIEETTSVTGSTETVEKSPSPETGESSATSATNSVGVISLDARLDCRADEEPTNRSGYRELFEAGLDALAVLGARHFESSTTEAEYLRDRDGMVVTAEEVGDDPVEAADRALGAVEEVDQIYVSIDLSVLDSAVAPGVSDPAPGGLSTRELFRVVRLLASDDRIAGFELVEAVPALDREGQTVEAAARTVAHAVASVSQS